MRDITACYSEHAINISDSYCSGPSNRPYVSQNSTPSIREAVSCIYKARKKFLIKITWCSLSGQGFTINVCEGNPSSNSKFGSYSRQLRKLKGSKKFEFCNSKVDIIWDLSSAKYVSGPEPISGYYVSVFIDSELGLLLGDMKDVLELRKLKNGIEYSIISRSEHFSGNDAVYTTKARFCDSGLSHEITIRCVGEEKGRRNSVLEICIDKKNVIKVKRLQWNFRGNQTIFVDGILVDMMWDLHDWLFSSSSSGSSAVFMFKTRSGDDSRLWMEENDQFGFCLLICASKNPE
ncbi:uncharacterized protein LOC124938430 [Impatiens glandulifera]|uniref:uncharacterized protein LOC124938430 n=1 Tax=Impatiens glandulifera TaxID=253017 RepID=UPI001FB19E79|nr:uncharacterized protein LOC124938430 [Impatiens glandulifera]